MHERHGSACGEGGVSGWSRAELRRVLGRLRCGETPEQAWSAVVDAGRRKRLGQFFTPLAVARAMVRWACAERARRLLDPAVGPGVFLEAVRAERPAGLRQVTAVDVDGAALELARARWLRRLRGWGGRNGARDAAEVGRRGPRAAARFVQGDALSLMEQAAYDAVVCNPPYVRHHTAKLPEAVFARFDRAHGQRFSRLTNVYGLFLVQAASWLSAGGRAAVITPAEFLNADFGRAVKAALLASGALRGFVVFDHFAAVFDGAITTAAITLLDRSGDVTDVAFVRARRVADAWKGLAALEHGGAAGIAVRRIPRGELDPRQKWCALADERPIAVRGGRRGSARPESGQARLSDWVTCQRGIATGANDFFTLTESEVERWRLPREVLLPCVTKACDAPGGAFTAADFERLRAAGRKVWLLNVPRDGARGVMHYLAYGESLGIQQRYLTRHRKPWYVMEQRAPADLWVTTFGRGRMRFVRNLARVWNLTAFHCLWMRPERRGSVAELIRWLASWEFAEAARGELRRYGDGLLKLEPADVLRLPAPAFASVREAAMSHPAKPSRREVWS